MHRIFQRSHLTIVYITSTVRKNLNKNPANFNLNPSLTGLPWECKKWHLTRTRFIHSRISCMRRNRTSELPVDMCTTSIPALRIYKNNICLSDRLNFVVDIMPSLDTILCWYLLSILGLYQVAKKIHIYFLLKHECAVYLMVSGNWQFCSWALVISTK